LHLVGHFYRIWDTSKWLHDRQHELRPGYPCESQIFTVGQDIADYLDEGVRIDAIIIDFSKTFDLVPCDWLLIKIAASAVDSRTVGWVRKFL
jgi:hypothetical protein